MRRATEPGHQPGVENKTPPSAGRCLGRIRCSRIHPFPCAGITQVRFKGSVADTATLSAGLTPAPPRMNLMLFSCRHLHYAKQGDTVSSPHAVCARRTGPPRRRPVRGGHRPRTLGRPGVDFFPIDKLNGYVYLIT